MYELIPCRVIDADDKEVTLECIVGDTSQIRIFPRLPFDGICPLKQGTLIRMEVSITNKRIKIEFLGDGGKIDPTIFQTNGLFDGLNDDGTTIS